MVSGPSHGKSKKRATLREGQWGRGEDMADSGTFAGVAASAQGRGD